MTDSPSTRYSSNRPRHITAAGLIFMVAGSYWLISLIVPLAGIVVQAPSQDYGPEFALAVTGVIVRTLPFLVLIAAIGAALLVTGTRVLAGVRWARGVGIVLAVVGALYSLLAGGDPDGWRVILSVVFLAAYIYAAWALWSNSAWFAQRPAA